MVDKPPGLTSHDAVAQLRRALGTPRIGHAGTLDPMASGVLVILAGEATKLAPYLTAQDKRYEARVALGVGTDTLDAEGEITTEQPIPAWLEAELGRLAAAGALDDDAHAAHDAHAAYAALSVAAPRIAAAVAAERVRHEQVPPAYSAIKIGGERSYRRARAGEEVELLPRPVTVRALRVLRAAASPPSLDLSLEVTKGYYVRSLARDIGAHLGVSAHLTALRRTASGALGFDRALPLGASGEALREALVPLEQAAQIGLPAARLTEEGAQRARVGKRLRIEDFSTAPPAGAAAWIAPNGQLVAIGAEDPARHEGEGERRSPTPGETRFVVLRGFGGPHDSD